MGIVDTIKTTIAVFICAVAYGYSCTESTPVDMTTASKTTIIIPAEVGKQVYEKPIGPKPMFFHDNSYRVISGKYFKDGVCITSDGVMPYQTSYISGRDVWDGMPVYCIINDNGTPTDLSDDEFVGVVYDKCTDIVDSLEISLEQKFEIERNGHELAITDLK